MDAYSLILIFLIFLSKPSNCSITCKSGQGKDVDWFVGYKLPNFEGVEPLEGLKFLYADQHSPSWSLPQNISSSDGSAIGITLSQVYKRSTDVFYMLYNDDHPGNGETYSHFAHAKGVLLFNEENGFWMIHSVPNFPPADYYSYPHSGIRNGQSFLCISFKTKTLTVIAKQLYIMRPSVYSSQLPTSFASKYPQLQDIITGKKFGGKQFYSKEELSSRGNFLFSSLAKNRKFAKDLYMDLVAPSLKSSILVETWLNGPGDLLSNCTSSYHVHNIRSVNVDETKFENSKDHSKWAVTDKHEKPWICIGDINRQKSQFERGGGTVCMLSPSIWKLFKNSIVNIEPCLTKYDQSPSVNNASDEESSNWFFRFFKKIISRIFG